jgi:ubiquinone/menaquinone biosynthesis C-methylase UbiE
VPINFHDPANGLTYAQRTAGPEWVASIRRLLDCGNPRVVDIGCGGGTYCLGWLDVAAASVVGVDFSQANLRGAALTCGEDPRLSWRLGDAVNTGLPDGSADVVFQRALIHHLPDLASAFTEARRLLTPGGQLIVQDRTMSDVLQPGTPSHLRGYFFTAFPKLVNIERKRRPDPVAVRDRLREAGFTDVTEHRIIETRRTYPDREAVRADIRARTGRSILHELTDSELAVLADEVVNHLPEGEPVTEVDHWTVWAALTGPRANDHQSEGRRS